MSTVAPDAVAADPPAEPRLWQAWTLHRDANAREQLILQHTGLARAMAAQTYARRTLQSIGFDDYLQWSMVGLIESIDRFAPERGIPFAAFAIPRLRGAILNGLEVASEQHQQIAARKRLLRERRASITDAAPSAGKRDPLTALAEVAIGLAIGFMLDDAALLADDSSSASDNAYVSLELRQVRQRLECAVNELGEPDRSVIRDHYYQQQPFGDIAARLKLSKGRISQIHHRGLKRLRQQIKPALRPDFEG